MKTNSQESRPYFNWSLLLKIVIAVLSAILGVIGEANLHLTSALFNL